MGPMYSVGDKIIYGEQGLCEVAAVGHVAMRGVARDRVFYTLRPASGGGVIYAPVDSGVFMRPAMTRQEAEDFLSRVPGIPPAVCPETKITRADAYYKSVFSSHSCEALVALLKGLSPGGRGTERRQTLNLRLERIVKRARELLEGELSAAMDISSDEAQELLTRSLRGSR